MPSKAFSLAELLIALLILGQIATFTIPKVLNAQQSSRNIAVTKEAAAMLSAAYSAYRLQNTPGANTGSIHLTPYLNYVSVQTTGSVDNHGAGTTHGCDNSTPCLRLHNGAVLQYWANETFGGTTSLHCIAIHVDPDGKVSNSQIVGFKLYFNGRLTTEGNVFPGSLAAMGGVVGSAGGGADAPWFSW